MAGTIDELKALAEKLEIKDGGPKATKLAQKMFTAVPRFEAGEEVSFLSIAYFGYQYYFWRTQLLCILLTHNRNASAVIIANSVKNSSSDPSLAFRFTKAALGARK